MGVMVVVTLLLLHFFKLLEVIQATIGTLD
jgi:hypothetical protein